MSDRYNLARFVEAQVRVYDNVVCELAAGRKRSHWMWFIFPQIAGLGSSGMAQKFAISCQAEATAYLQHPVLGGRLVACTELVVDIDERSALDIFGSPDDLKFRSSMTLFASVAGDQAAFDDALAKFFSGVPDHRTLDILAGIED